MKAMNVDLIKAAKIVAELYAGTAPSITTAAAATATPAQLPVTEAQRYWANAKELRDLVLEEVWRVASDPTGAQRNEELVEAVKNTLRLPLARRTGLPPMAPLEMVSAARAADGGERHGPPVYLGSILGIDLELQDKGDELPRLVKHPHASKEFGWHRNVRPEEGFQAVEQSIYWEVRRGEGAREMKDALGGKGTRRVGGRGSSAAKMGRPRRTELCLID